MIITASVSLKRPRTVEAARQHLKGFVPYPGRTGPGCGTGGDQEQDEACQAEGGCGGQGDGSPSGRSGADQCRFRTEMSYGWRPSAHGGSDSQGAPCASCRHAGDL